MGCGLRGGGGEGHDQASGDAEQVKRRASARGQRILFFQETGDLGIPGLGAGSLPVVPSNALQDGPRQGLLFWAGREVFALGNILADPAFHLAGLQILDPGDGWNEPVAL